MKTLQINYSDYAFGGGATIAMHRLHVGLTNLGIDSKILSGKKTLKTDDASAIRRNHRLERLLGGVTAKTGLNDIQCISSFGIKQDPFYSDAEIVNFHIMHSGYFSYLALPTLSEGKPLVITLHDMWNFTGHCAYSYDCSKWKSGCGQCPDLGVYPPIERDSTRLEWKLKNWVYEHSDITVIAPSKWLTEQAQQSMLNRFPIHCIPYGLDLKTYQPIDQNDCRSALGIPKNKYVLMFAAFSLEDSRKGGDLLASALRKLPDSLKKNCFLLMIGGGIGSNDIDIPSLELGYVSNERFKAIAYSAADLFIFPTRADNLPLVLQESMACGTPMITFDVGGVSDLVRSGETGFTADAEDVEGFRDAIVNLLEDSELRLIMRKRCREIAEAEYSLPLQAERYLKVYQELLER